MQNIDFRERKIVSSKLCFVAPYGKEFKMKFSLISVCILIFSCSFALAEFPGEFQVLTQAKSDKKKLCKLHE